LSNCARAALAIISSVSPVESETRWRCVRFIAGRRIPVKGLWRNAGINHGRSLTTSSGSKTMPANRVSASRSVNTCPLFPQAGDSEEKFDSTQALRRVGVNGRVCKAGEIRQETLVPTIHRTNRLHHSFINILFS
jgi:hypothetical protein